MLGHLPLHRRRAHQGRRADLVAADRLRSRGGVKPHLRSEARVDGVHEVLDRDWVGEEAAGDLDLEERGDLRCWPTSIGSAHASVDALGFELVSDRGQLPASSSGTRRNASPMGRVSEMSTEGIPEIRDSSASDTAGSTSPRSARTAATGRPLEAASKARRRRCRRECGRTDKCLGETPGPIARGPAGGLIRPPSVLPRRS